MLQKTKINIKEAGHGPSSRRLYLA